MNNIAWYRVLGRCIGCWRLHTLLEWKVNKNVNPCNSVSVPVKFTFSNKRYSYDYTVIYLSIFESTRVMDDAKTT